MFGMSEMVDVFQPTRWIGQTADYLRRRDLGQVGWKILREVRQAALEDTLEEFRPRADQLADGLLKGEASAREALTHLGEQALAAMRARVHRLAGQAGWRERIAALGDRIWYDGTLEELMDDPALEADRRTRIINELDDLNALVHTNDEVLRSLRPLLKPDGTTRILDLASGHGGMALALARLGRDAGLSLEITASDLKSEYLELGKAHAQAEGLDVHFRVQDALDLRNLADEPYHVVMCIQALHHFPPGLLAVMFEAAMRKAETGVLFFDACRGMAPAMAVGALAWLRFGNRDFVHDTVVSLRRAYTPEELALLARLGSWGDGLHYRGCAPGHCMLWRHRRDP